MTISIDLPPSNDSPQRVRTELITPLDQEEFDKWLQLRQKYMEVQGWHYGDDHDRYDDDPRTLHVVKEREDTKDIMVGMRLTPCDSVEESLSLSMLSPKLQEQVRENLPGDMNNIWDLTRLIPGNLAKEEAVDVILETFGTGLAASLSRSPEGLPPQWIFATTPAFAAFFRRQGIDFIELARGKNKPGDTKDTVFCYARPAEDTARIRREEHPSHIAVDRGVEAAEQVL